jgi:hypothetical protein
MSLQQADNDRLDGLTKTAFSIDEKMSETFFEAR